MITKIAIERNKGRESYISNYGIENIEYRQETIYIYMNNGAEFYIDTKSDKFTISIESENNNEK